MGWLQRLGCRLGGPVRNCRLGRLAWLLWCRGVQRGSTRRLLLLLLCPCARYRLLLLGLQLLHLVWGCGWRLGLLERYERRATLPRTRTVSNARSSC